MKLWEQHWTLCSWWEGQSGKLVLYNLPCGSNCQPPYQGNTLHCLFLWMIQVQTEQFMSIFSNTYVIPCWMGECCSLPAGNPGFGRWLQMLPWEVTGSFPQPPLLCWLTIPCKADEDSRSLKMGPCEGVWETGTLLMEEVWALRANSLRYYRFLKAASNQQSRCFLMECLESQQEVLFTMLVVWTS